MKPVIDTVYILFWGIVALILIYQSVKKKPNIKNYKSYRIIIISMVMLYFIITQKIFN